MLLIFNANGQSYYNDSVFYAIINGLLETKYRDVGLVAVELDKPSAVKAYFIDANGDTSEMDPPPPPPISAPIYFYYDKMMFINMYYNGQLDSIEAENMFQRLDSVQSYNLDSSQIIVKTFHYQSIKDAFRSKGFEKGYHYMDKRYSKIGYLKLSTPVFNNGRDKCIISISAFKSSSWTSITYLFKKIENNWHIAYSQYDN